MVFTKYKGTYSVYDYNDFVLKTMLDPTAKQKALVLGH